MPPKVAPPEAALEDVASTGVPELDEALGGLFWGDNIVFEVPEAPLAKPFYRAVAKSPEQYDERLYIGLSGKVGAGLRGFDLVDASPDGPLAQPAPLLGAIVDRCVRGARNLLLFEPMEAMIDRWGAEVAGRFFALCCPQLLQLGAIAYWSVPTGLRGRALRRTIEEITQCVFVVESSRLRIAKADGRPPGVEGSVFHYRDANGLPELAPAPVVARIGAALRAARTQRQLSQSAVARLAGVSPSAISQAERGQRGLSLETLLELTANLNMTLDELLRGEVVTGYRLARRSHPPSRRMASGQDPLPLLDDPAAGMRAYLIRLPARQSAAPSVTHKGTELVAVANGLVQVILATGRPVLRGGEALLVETATIERWRNVGSSEAVLFWILRD
jgi:transcriptional regulator with XRE-family HTH domain